MQRIPYYLFIASWLLQVVPSAQAQYSESVLTFDPNQRNFHYLSNDAVFSSYDPSQKSFNVTVKLLNTDINQIKVARIPSLDPASAEKFIQPVGFLHFTVATSSQPVFLKRRVFFPPHCRFKIREVKVFSFSEGSISAQEALDFQQRDESSYHLNYASFYRCSKNEQELKRIHENVQVIYPEANEEDLKKLVRAALNPPGHETELWAARSVMQQTKYRSQQLGEVNSMGSDNYEKWLENFQNTYRSNPESLGAVIPQIAASLRAFEFDPDLAGSFAAFRQFVESNPDLLQHLDARDRLVFKISDGRL